MRSPFRLSFLFFVPVLLAADVRLPALLSDHMMLQSGLPVHVWGWADPGEEVEAVFRGETVVTTADATGDWELWLSPQEPGGPFEMEVVGDNRITIADILVGEVWVGSGQSNMVWSVGQSAEPEEEIAAADYPKIRIFQVKLATAATPLDDVEGEWKLASPDTIGDFSAVGYYFARALHKETGLPFGVIQSAWGGTPAEAWTTSESLAGDAGLRPFVDEWRQVVAAYPRAAVRYEQRLKDWEAERQASRQSGANPPQRPRAPRGPGHQHEPAGLFNAMIAPLTPFAIRGVIWYQGENNANRAHGDTYGHLFRTMISDWRREWSVGLFPFLFVQLANYARVPETSEWPELREAQQQALRLRNTGMAVTIDIGDSSDIHPKNKQDVGKRLALWALQQTYEAEDLVYSGPLYRQMTVDGGRARIWFDHVGGGLRAEGELEGFEIAGPEGVFEPANARIEGETVLVWSGSVREPVAVLYAWRADPQATLFNKAGLPAGPFRTDNWRD